MADKYEDILAGTVTLGHLDCTLLEYARGIKYFVDAESRRPNCDTHLINLLRRAACVGWENIHLFKQSAISAPAPQPVQDAGEQVRLLLSERVAHAARQFCEEVQEDAEGVPQPQLENLNKALDAWEPLAELPDGPYDDSRPALAALQSLAADPHATDNQRRLAHLAHGVIVAHEEKIDKELRRLQDGVRDHLINLGAPGCLIDGAGCDSGDPLDFTKAEITQAFNYFKETDNEPRI